MTLERMIAYAGRLGISLNRWPHTFVWFGVSAAHRQWGYKVDRHIWPLERSFGLGPFVLVLWSDSVQWIEEE